MNEMIHLLLIEDDEGDAYLIREMLSETAQDVLIKQTGRLSAAAEKLAAGGFDIVLADLGLPDSHGLQTVRSLCEKFKNLPLIVLTGLSDEKVGMQALQEGAQDYLVKGQISGGLLTKAIRYSIERKRISNEKEQLIVELQDALVKVRVLQGLLPICSSCKKIRDDKGYWQQIEGYISEHSEAEFSHGICPPCAEKLYPSIFPKKE